jgi:hypothetical protein
LSFFVFGVSRLFLPCFGLSRVLVCRGRFCLFICSPWLSLKGSRLACLSRVCGGCLHPVAGCCLSVLSVLSVCLCVPVSVAGFHPVAGRVLQAVAVCLYPCQAVRRSNKCSIRVVRTSFRNKCSNGFFGQSGRISNRIRTEFRLCGSVCLTES